MLTRISVRDFAVVRVLDVGFATGLTVVTGETGAGKSILLDALGLALGDRASADIVRPGAARAEIAAEFLLASDSDAVQWLREHELDEPDEPEHLRLRRTLGADGRSRAYINGRAVNVQDLATIGEWLADIQGQHAHQSLLRRPVQLALLDAHADALPLARATREAWQAWQQAQAELKACEPRGPIADELEWLGHQLVELDAVAEDADRYDALSDEHRRLAGGDALRAAVLRAGELLQGGESDARGLVHAAAAELRALRTGDAAIDQAIGALSELASAIEDVGRDLHRYEQSLRADPERLAELDDRLAQIHAVARKHRVAPTDIADVRTRLADRRDAHLEAEARLPRLQAAVRDAEVRFHRLAEELATARLAAAPEFVATIREEIRRLGMPHADFVLGWQDDFGPHGRAMVEYRVSTNPELPPGPLTRVASGGELSRISLAIHTVAASRSRVPTLVLDEADAGIGGATAEIVGRTLRTLGAHAQVLCVTHVPQVAAQGEHHLRVTKDDAGTQISTLDRPARVDELARMIGGTRITSATLARADEMLRLGAESATELGVAEPGPSSRRSTRSRQRGAGQP